MNGRIGNRRRVDGLRPRMKLIKCAAYLSLLVISQAASQTARESRSYLKQAAISETAGTVHIVANSPRPVAQTLDALQQKYGWVVGYEDPQFNSKLDLVEAEDAGGRPPATKVPSRIPAGGQFSVDFPASTTEEDKTLQIVVDAYNRSNNPGRFELRKSKQGTFSVVGVEARDAQGKLSKQPVLFDVPITLANRQRTASATLKLICQKIAADRHIAVTIGVAPRKLLAHDVTVGGTKVSARELLIQTLASTRHSFYWRLLFDPNSKGYFLDIHSTRTS
jgi:hypothetical protein